MSHSKVKALENPLKDLLGWFREGKYPHLIIGGVAASLLGSPRATKDIDLVTYIDTGDLEDLCKSAEPFGFEPRIKQSLDFAKQHRVLLMRHKKSRIDIDISLAALPFEKEAIQKAKIIRIGEMKIPLPRPEDLIIMKAVANRPRDIADVEALFKRHLNVDLKRIRYWVREFSKALQRPDILENLENILKKVG